MKNLNILQNEKVKQLHQAVVDTVHKAKTIGKNHLTPEEESRTAGEKLSDIVFNIGSSWAPILLFTTVVIAWVLFNSFVSVKYRFDPFPFLLMTFLLAGIAAVQAPFIMMSQHRNGLKNSKKLAVNLKVENEILALHQSITVLIEQQLQQVLENQAMVLKSLQDLQLKDDKLSLLIESFESASPVKQIPS
ncbi:hypothetical protein WSM22_45780 [Cytophagales bacterium WSM2-2]|nr:hypothetical protein WSM22_45780 [Cytophagales bacterium WSM2-2]